MSKDKYKIKVDNSINRIPRKDRIPFDLIVGETYYLSYGGNVAEPCILESKTDLPESKIKAISVILHLRKQISSQSIYSNEIGRTPEEAVQNES
ncbi:hypothetical protein [Sphingobacterium sp.]|uniref:hypothetical protein n=1 Tax=Sphingobacterium sp. TaxID=341027 RepID=UPI0028995791|nr:hypothetical protein [Sphingobacterium sp.]